MQPIMSQEWDDLQQLSDVSIAAAELARSSSLLQSCSEHHDRGNAHSTVPAILVGLQGLQQRTCDLPAWLGTPCCALLCLGMAEIFICCLQRPRLERTGQPHCQQRQRCLCCRPLLTSTDLRGW